MMVIKKIVIYLPEEDLKLFDLICDSCNTSRSQYIIDYLRLFREKMEKRKK